MLSVRPRFAKAIIDGHKTVDVRRQRPNVRPGTLGFVYSSSPMQAVIGSFRVDNIFSGTPEKLWLMARDKACMAREDFDKYFAGIDMGHGIVISCVKKLQRPIRLSHLRAIWPGCKPPRSFGYLVTSDAYSQRIMAIFRDRLFSHGNPLEESNGSRVNTNGSQGNRGSFLLKGAEVRALVSLLGAED